MDGPIRYNRMMILLVVTILFSSSGATCIRRNTASDFQTPLLFQSPPSIQQLADAINRTKGIQQLQSTSVSVRMAGIPSLKAHMAWERPSNFRLRGGITSWTGTDLDLGSNAESFWMAVRQGPVPSLYYASHAMFDQQLNRQQLPVSPLWLVEAMGVIEFDPFALTSQPQTRSDGMLELTTTVPSAAGSFIRTLVVDPKYGTVKQVVLRDPTGRLLASSLMSNHKYYDSVQCSLPHLMQIQLVPSGGPPLDLAVEVGFYGVNSLEGNDPTRFTMPDARGYQAIDLIQLNLGNASANIPPSPQPVQMMQPTANYRGFDNPNVVR